MFSNNNINPGGIQKRWVYLQFTQLMEDIRHRNDRKESVDFMLFDTHTHMDAPQFDEDREVAIQRALEAGVTRMINIGFNRETIPTTMKLAETYDFIYATVGWHPVDAITMEDQDLDWIASLCSHEKVVAIGEIGLDYYWDTSPKEVQHRVLRRQIGLARN